MRKEGIQTAVAGVSGYAGLELARLLLHHPALKGRPPVFVGRDAEAIPLTEMHPQLADNNGSSGLLVEPFSWQLLKERGVELLFLATPHEQSRSWVPEALEHGLKVVDLSAAWRLREPENRTIYGFHDADTAVAEQVQTKSVYGLPELHRACIRNAQLVANPGCYATSIILALKPLVAGGWVDLNRGIICDSKSGVSGAGKSPTAKTHFVEVDGDFSAYSVFGHRHTGEVLEQLGLGGGSLQFTPHLLPIPRGILSTIYVKLAKPATSEELEQTLREFYAGKPWVRVFGAARLPQIKFSLNTNYCDIGFSLSPDGKRAVLVSCIDNLLKGAAGQAVQNMNLMFGFDEKEGLQ